MRRVCSAVVAVAAILSACGGDDAPGRKVLTYRMALPPTSVGFDPALPEDGYLGDAVHRRLYVDPLGPDGLVPDIADGPPKVAADGRSVTVRLKRDVRFSPPVSRAVTADDVVYAIERLFKPQVASPFSGSFVDVAGAAEYQAGKAKRIEGLKTPDEHTLVIRLTRPTGRALAAALSLTATAPVPREYAEPFDRESPSTYARSAVYTGAYAPEHDDRFRAIQRRGVIRLLRNPSWRSGTDPIRAAHLDEIVLSGGSPDPTVHVKRTLDGRATIYSQEATSAAIRLATRGPKADQLTTFPRAETLYLALNHQIEPLDDPRVRRAIAAAVDRRAVTQTIAAGAVATHFLPPTLPGFEESGGEAGHGVEFLAKPEGDLELARSLLRQAGFADGYDGPPLRFIAIRGPFSGLTSVVRARLEELGLELEVVEADPVKAFRELCGAPRTAICMTSLFAPFDDPAVTIGPAFDGRHLGPKANRNASRIDDPELTNAIATAEVLVDERERAERWAQIDAELVADAHAVPLMWPHSTIFRSADVRNVVSDVTNNLDLANLDLAR